MENTARRIYIGIKVPDALAVELAKHQREFSSSSMRPIPKEDMHLTLVPPWQETEIEKAGQKLQELISGTRAFEIVVQTISYGPDPRRPRLVWATCSRPPELELLQGPLQREFGREERWPFTPHITLARFTENRQELPPLNVPLYLPFPVERVHLFESPGIGGVGYKVLREIRLAGAH